jgi:hypothetical protein
VRSYFQFSCTESRSIWRICLRICRVSGRDSYILLYLPSYLRPVWLYLPPNLELTNVAYFCSLILVGRSLEKLVCLLFALSDPQWLSPFLCLLSIGDESLGWFIWPRNIAQQTLSTEAQK